MPCQFGDSPMSLDKKNYITGKQKRQALFLNFLNFFINIYKIPNSTICREAFMAKHLWFLRCFAMNASRQIFHPDKNLSSERISIFTGLTNLHLFPSIHRSLRTVNNLLKKQQRAVRNDRLIFHFLKEQSLCRSGCPGFCSVSAFKNGCHFFRPAFTFADLDQCSYNDSYHIV